MSLARIFVDVQRWPASRKTALLAGILLPGHLVLWQELRGLRTQHDETATRALETWAQCGLLVTAAVFAVALALAWRGREGRWLPYALAVAYALLVDWGMQLGWNVTALSWIPLTALLFAFHFDERVGATLLALSLLASLPMQMGIELMPTETAGVEEAIETLWPQVVAVLVILNFLYCALVLAAQRLLEQRLSTANALIRRYVPAQLADRILAGGHDASARHERRKLTIFFSDVAGFTAQSDELDAEDFATLLNEYLAEMTVIGDRFGATVNQLVGDGIMIFFGAPAATDDRDHALRAVRMAQAMQQRMVELREAWFRRGLQRPFHIRIGINTGFASVGDFGSPGRMMYSAIGQQTNLAARIQAQCPPDRILLSHSTWALVQDTIQCTPRGEIEAKGLHYPVLVYEVAEAVSRNAA